MPYSKISEAPANIRKLNDVPLTLSQVNWIARVADGIPKDQVESPWAVAIAQFKRSHKIADGKWVKRNTEKKSVIHVEKQKDGRYSIVAISTAALKDDEGETFTTEAMDYDIAAAKESGEYPEFRVFHQVGLGIGKVTKMTRVGIFAVDSGYSYDDPFSLQVCEKMLRDNFDGKWKVSRGFRVLEVSGGCPQCAENLVINTKHMIAGYRCPSCGDVNLGYKGILKDVQFRKTKTFESSITDVPAVMHTGVQAFPILKDLPEDFIMKKDQLKQKLLDAGVDEALIDERMKNVDEDVLKSLGDIPDAIALKDMESLSDFFKTDPAKKEDHKVEDEEEEDEDETKELDDEILEIGMDALKEMVSDVIRPVIADELKKALDGFTITVDDMDGFEIEVKELPEIAHVLEALKTLTESVEKFTKTEEERVEKIVKEAPRNAKLRVCRAKSVDPEDKKDKKLVYGDVIAGADGQKADTMTKFLKE